ncbi:MAG: thioesterase family protein [Marinifilaceae bacterium]
MIEKGLIFEQNRTVKQNDTAATHGSGKLEVFATPALVAFMENTALMCIDPHLAANEDTVGTEICVKHIKPTAVGKNVFCKAEVTQVEGRKICFEIKAWDEDGDIGTGSHTRFIIDPERFMSKL